MDVTYWLKLSVDRILIDSMVQEFAENNPTKIDLTPEGLFMMTKEIIDRKQYWDNPMFHTLRTVNKQKEGESASAFILRQIDEMNSNRVKKDEIRAKVRSILNRRRFRPVNTCSKRSSRSSTIPISGPTSPLTSSTLLKSISPAIRAKFFPAKSRK